MSTLTDALSTPPLGTKLDAEWAHLATAPAATATLAAWCRTEPILDGYRDFAAVRDVVHDRDYPQRSDQVLAALVRLAAVTGHNDPDAAWLVVQLLKPGAVHLAARLAPLVGGPAMSEQLVFAELTIRIREYPWQRRPARIAANLLLDCRQRIVRDQQRHRLETPVEQHFELPERVVADPLDEPMVVRHLLWLACQRGILTRLEVDLLSAVYLHDTPMNQLTGVFGWSRSTLFALRAAAEQRLREAFGVSEPTPTQPEPVDTDRVVAAYLAGGSVTRLARRYEVSPRDVADMLRQAGMRLPGTRKPIDVDQLAGDYQAGASATALAQRHGISVNAVTRRLRQAGIRPRSAAEANQLRRTVTTNRQPGDCQPTGGYTNRPAGPDCDGYRLPPAVAANATGGRSRQ